jgi:hypothetical protein
VNVHVRFSEGKTAVVNRVTSRSDLTTTEDEFEDDEDEDERTSKMNCNMLGRKITLSPHALSHITMAPHSPSEAPPKLNQMFKKKKARQCIVTDVQCAELLVKWIVGDDSKVRAEVTLLPSLSSPLSLCNPLPVSSLPLSPSPLLHLFFYSSLLLSSFRFSL